MKKDILGVMVDDVTMDDAVLTLSGYLGSKGRHIVVTPNAEILIMCNENPQLMEAIGKASFVAPDGVGVLRAAKILGTPLSEKVAGCDLGFNLLSEAAKKGSSVYLFGAKPGTAETAAQNLCKKVPGLNIAGVRNGYFTPEDTESIIDGINKSGADILFVCLGAPKQELWMAEHADKLDVSVMLGLGGSLDVYAGTVKRAPKLMIDMKLEWLYRLIKEPYRLGRMLRIPAVLGLARKEAKRRRKNGKA